MPPNFIRNEKALGRPLHGLRSDDLALGKLSMLHGPTAAARAMNTTIGRARYWSRKVSNPFLSPNSHGDWRRGFSPEVMQRLAHGIKRIVQRRPAITVRLIIAAVKEHTGYHVSPSFIQTVLKNLGFTHQVAERNLLKERIKHWYEMTLALTNETPKSFKELLFPGELQLCTGYMKQAVEPILNYIKVLEESAISDEELTKRRELKTWYTARTGEEPSSESVLLLSSCSIDLREYVTLESLHAILSVLKFARRDVETQQQLHSLLMYIINNYKLED